MGLKKFFSYAGVLKDAALTFAALAAGFWLFGAYQGRSESLDKLDKLNKVNPVVRYVNSTGNKKINRTDMEKANKKENLLEQLIDKYACELKSGRINPEYGYNDNFKHDSDLMLLARMVFGEARNQPLEAMVGVAYTAVNRMRIGGWYGESLGGVLLKPRQYSCFNKNDPNKEKLKGPLKYEKPEIFAKCLAVAYAVLHNLVKDPTNGATHYFSGNRPPKWARKMERCGKIGDFKFYKESRTICK